MRGARALIRKPGTEQEGPLMSTRGHGEGGARLLSQAAGMLVRRRDG